MNCLFDRMLSSDLGLHESHIPFLTISINRRIRVHLFSDDPFYVGIFYVDGVPTLKEEMISDVPVFADTTQKDLYFQAFLQDYANNEC